MEDIITRQVQIIRSTIPNIVGKNSSWLRLFAEYDVNVTISDVIVTLTGNKKNVRDVEIKILDSMANVYSIFEHPSKIYTLVNADGDKTFSFKHYKDGIQNRYRLSYDPIDPSYKQVVRAIEFNNQFEQYSSDRLHKLLTRDNKFSVSIGRNTFYSSSRDKYMNDKTKYTMNNIRTMSVGYGRDIKVRWDPELTVKQIEYLENRIHMPLDGEYYKSKIIATDKINKCRIHANIRIKSKKPVESTFTTKIENLIDKTVIISRMDNLPDIRYKYVIKSSKIPSLQYSDISIKDNLISIPSNNYITGISFINHIKRYRNKNITIKLVHNITDDYHTVMFSSHDPFVALEYINNIFSIR